MIKKVRLGQSLFSILSKDDEERVIRTFNVLYFEPILSRVNINPDSKQTIRQHKITSILPFNFLEKAPQKKQTSG